MRAQTVRGSTLAALAAFVWATYYVFISEVHSANAFSIFLYPSLAGGILFAVAGLAREGRFPRPRRARDYLLPGLGYISSQVLIIYSTLANGGVLTSTFILLGDTIFSPAIIYLLGRTRFRPRPGLLLVGMAVLVTSAILLTLLGGYVSLNSSWGLLLLVLIPPALSLFFIYTNERIMEEGMAEILTPAFLVSSLIVFLFLAAFGGPGALSFGSVRGLVILIVVGITSMFVGYVLFFRASRLTGFTLSSILMALIPPFTLLLSVLFLGIPPTPFSITLIILAAVGAGLCTLAFSGEGTAKQL